MVSDFDIDIDIADTPLGLHEILVPGRAIKPMQGTREALICLTRRGS